MATASLLDPAVVKRAVERAAPSVVGLGRGWHAGSGVVIAPGRVLTVAHAAGREAVAVSIGGERVEARVVAIDQETNLAVLEADTGDAPAIEVSTAGHPGLAATVVALADPGGRGLRATAGQVASDERTIRGPRGRRISGAIEHTAPLPRGSSGGPLVDEEGRLLGLNAIRETGGLILAVPTPRERIERLAGGETPERARLGVAVAPPEAAKRLRRAVGLPDRDGLLVRGVRDDSAAARAGIERGDLLVSAGGTPVADVDELYRVLDDLAAGATLEIALLRGAEERTVTVSFEA